MELKKKFYLKEEKHFVNKKIKNEKKKCYLYILSVSYYFLLLFYLIILINN